MRARPTPLLVALGIGLAGISLARPAAASDDTAVPASDPAPDPAPAAVPAPNAGVSVGRQALAVGAAIVPGIVVHGMGSWVVGKGTTAKKLAIASGAALASSVLGVALIAVTGASRRTVGPLAAFTVTSVGVFSTTFLADLYAVLAPEGGTGAPLREAPGFEASVGAYAVSDPIFRHSGIVTERIDARWKTLRTSLVAEHAPGSAARRWRVEEAIRFVGPLPQGEKASDGSFVDLEGALGDHAYAHEGFGTTVAEVALRGRLDLVRFDGELRGAFVEGQLGGGLMVDRYRSSSESDTNSLLLARFAFGTYLGVPSPDGVHGEASLYYDHRRDGWVGGLQPNGIGAGYLGSIGATGRMWIGRSWGIGTNLQAGSALLGGLSLHFRSGVL